MNWINFDELDLEAFDLELENELYDMKLTGIKEPRINFLAQWIVDGEPKTTLAYYDSWQKIIAKISGEEFHFRVHDPLLKEGEKTEYQKECVDYNLHLIRLARIPDLPLFERIKHDIGQVEFKGGDFGKPWLKDPQEEYELPNVIYKGVDVTNQLEESEIEELLTLY